MKIYRTVDGKLIRGVEVSQSKKFVKSSSGKDWMGIPGVHMIWHGEWADPEIEHDGVIANYVDVEENLRYEAENAGVNADDDAEFDEFIRKNKNLVYELIDEAGERGEIESGCHGKSDKRRREKKEDELESSRRRIKSSASLPITELDVEIGRNDKGDVVYENTKFGTYRLLKADGRLEEVSMDGGRAESILDKWSRSYGIEYNGKLNSSVSRNAITFSKFNRISSLFIKNDRLVEGEECVIQIKDKNGRWEDVSYDREKPYWSIKGKPKMFSDEKTARKSALMKALNDAGYSEEAGNLQISMS